MSIRAVCLDASDDRLVLRATPDDVRLFGKGQELDVQQAVLHEAMDMLARQGWRPQPVPEEMRHMSGWMANELMSGRRSSCAARLRTQCGCERVMMVPWPPPSSVRVAMHDRLSAMAPITAENALQTTTSFIREFRWTREVLTGQTGLPEPQYAEHRDSHR